MILSILTLDQEVSQRVPTYVDATTANEGEQLTKTTIKLKTNFKRFKRISSTGDSFDSFVFFKGSKFLADLRFC